MDTCESGEVDDDNEAKYYTMANHRGIKARTTRAIKLVLKKKKKKQTCNENQRGIMLKAKQKGSSTGGESSKTPQCLLLGKKKSRSYLLEKDLYIYNDLIRRSGAIVFSSSKGGEFSYESDKVQNGYFTDELLKAFTSKVADHNKDGIVSTDELRKYVSAEVPKHTQNLQHPTVDRDNIYQKFDFVPVQ